MASGDTELIITIVHDGGTDFTPTVNIDGFLVSDDAGFINPVSVERISATEIKLTFAEALVGGVTAWYIRDGTGWDNGQVVRDNAVGLNPLNLPLEPGVATATASGSVTPILSADFTNGSGPDFAFVTNAFVEEKGATNSTYVVDTELAHGALQLELGGIDGNDILNMSGGWEATLNIAAAADVTLSFRYNLSFTSSYDPGEFSRVLVSLDDTLVGPLGSGADKFVDELVGESGSGEQTSTGWQVVRIDLGSLSAGQHKLAIGGFNNKKTTTSEITTILFDDVVVTSTVTDPSNDPPTATDDAISANENTPLAGANVITANNGNGVDSDPNTDPLTVSHVDGQSGNVGQAINIVSSGGRTGQVTIDANGDFAFDPMGNFEALGQGDSDTVTVDYTITDGRGGFDTATVTVTVDGVNDAPTLSVNDGASVSTAGEVVIESSDLAFADVDNTPAELTYTVTSAPANGQVKLNGSQTATFTQADVNAGLVTYAHGGGAGTSDSFVFSVSDGDGGQVAGQTFDVTVTGPTTTLIDADFNTGTEGFAYQDDTFRGTSEPGFADGTRVTSGGTGNSGALEISLGGINGTDIFDPGMSGGWQIGFTLAAAAQVSLSFFYRLDLSGSYESDEFSEVLVSLNDGSSTSLFGTGGNDYVQKVFGDGGSSTPRDVSEASVLLDLGTQAAGTYTLTLGGRNNKKTTTSENTVILVDDVVVTSTIADPSNDPPTATDDAISAGEDGPPAGTNVITTNNGNGVDSDPNGDALTVSRVDGLTGNVGQAINIVSSGGRTGQVTIEADGALTFDPLGNFEALGQGDSDTLTVDYTISDGRGGTDTATVTVTVNGVNDAPTLTVNDGVSVTTAGEVVIGSAELAFADVDNTAAELTYTLTTAPTDGEVQLNGTQTTSFTQADLNAGLVTYEHTGSNAADSFVFSVSDGDGGQVTGQTFDITITGPTSTIVDADFNTGTDGFTYQDDTFRGTSEPGFADGSRVTSGGVGNSGALEVELGGINGNDIFDPGMSGGWQFGFTLTEATQLTLDFFYRLDVSGSYESDEFSEVLVSLNDGSTTTLFGTGGNDFVDQVTGDGGSSNPRVISEDTVTLDLGLQSAGTYTLTLGGRNNKKTTTSENTVLTFDDVLLEGAAQAGGGAPAAAALSSNTAPNAVNDTATTDEATAFLVDVLGNDTDDDGDILTVIGIDTTGTSGNVTLNGDGTVLYDPAGAFDALAAGEEATDTFGYTISDGQGGTDTAIVTVTIDGTDILVS